jgi:hypothetical protein
MTRNPIPTTRRPLYPLAGALAALALLAAPAAGAQQLFDFCGCAGSTESKGAFDSLDPATWTAVGAVRTGTSSCDSSLRIPVPPDGVIVFDSLRLRNLPNIGCGNINSRVFFQGNAANTPVTILVKGDIFIEGGDILDLNGDDGANGTTGAAGVGGAGGPGGFAGGDGAYQIVNFASDGGAGVGPGGGFGSVATPRVAAKGGVFVGVPELRPMAGGSGGGGGHSAQAVAGCSGAGGGGGGGALVLAANGTVTINGTIRANGGAGGTRANSSCTSGGGGGSGGAVRILANRIEGSGSVTANGGGDGCCGGPSSPEGANAGAAGRVRLEAIANGFSVNGTSPVAIRAPAPGPLVNPITPTVRISAIDGALTPLEPIGYLGRIDMVVPAPGLVQIDLASTDVPAGTDLEVTVKPKVGGAPTSHRVTLAPAACNAGACSTAVSVDLAPGAYIVEARATFETP